MLIILNVAHACLCQLWHNRVHANFGTFIFMPTMAHFDEIVMVALSCLCQLKGELIKSTVQVSSQV